MSDCALWSGFCSIGLCVFVAQNPLGWIVLFLIADPRICGLTALMLRLCACVFVLFAEMFVFLLSV